METAPRPWLMQKPFNLACFFRQTLLLFSNAHCGCIQCAPCGHDGFDPVFCFESVLSSTTFICGSVSSQIEPLIAYFLNYGVSGINKIDQAKIKRASVFG
jgi:hypothetical protein